MSAFSDQQTQQNSYRHQQESYNQSQASKHEPERFQDSNNSETEQQFVYDSMSTILEVDSEESDASDSPPLEPLQVRTQLIPDSESHARRNADRTIGNVSPVSEDKFSGTLDALARQVERLRRSSQPELFASSSSSLWQQLPTDGQRDASTSTSVTSPTSDSRSLVSSPVEAANSPAKARDEPYGSRPNSRMSRPESTESLMMINVSPMMSPRVKFPILRTANTQREERPVVEVSNKSTVTAIDLALMDKMVEKYFVDRRDIGTQSIKFDCDDEFDTINFNAKDGSLRRRLKGAAPIPKPMTKSVAVGTESFSRERFSLLPPTKTRSTQTKSNMDNDIGVSETRRFKLSHQDFMRPLRTQNSSQDTTNTVKFAEPTKEEDPEKVSEKFITKTPEIDAGHQDARNTNMSNHNSSAPTPTIILETSKETNETSEPVDSLSESATLEQVEGTGKLTKKVSGNSTSANSEDSDSLQLSPHKDGPARVKVSEKQATSSNSLIPSVKTELRVIIEIQDSKERQRSELISDSQLVDGKLSKKTRVSTSKQVAASPRQVLDKLQSAGRQHSLMFQEAQRTATTPPAAVAAANLNALRWSERNSPQNEGEPTRSAHSDVGPIEWRQVSNSSVCNEIETDTRENSRKRKQQPTSSGGDIVLSSEATVSQLANDKSAIELRSRAAKRYEHSERDPQTGQAIKSGKTSERVLVESESGFNDIDIQALEQTAGTFERPRLTSAVKKASHGAKKLEDGPLVGLASRESPRQALVEEERKKLAERQAPDKQLRAEVLEHASRSSAQTPRSQAHIPRSPARSGLFKFEEETEDRKQVMKNGHLVYDDRLRERIMETSRIGTPPVVPVGEQLQRVRSASASPGSPLSGPILKNRTQTRTLLKPVSLRASPQTQPADQSSNVSSDPETMDSGFAQSGAGSSSVLNQARRQHPEIQAEKSNSEAKNKRVMSEPRQLQQDQLDESLTFVDDDVDELIDQLDKSRMLSPVTPAAVPLAPRTDHKQLEHQLDKRLKAPQRTGSPAWPKGRNFLISPPPAFRSSAPALNELGERDSPGLKTRTRPSTQVNSEPASATRNDTELTTKLTRTKRPNAQETKQTMTRFEQSIKAPASQLKAQMMFESDTDSMAESRQSAASSRSERHKEILSKTSYQRQDRQAPATDQASPKAEVGAEKGQAWLRMEGASEPKWDYSLRVNRMRGNKIDTKVNTYIKHSRQSLINSEAS